MSVETFTQSIHVRRPADDVFAWHERPGALERLTPPWERVEILASSGGIRNGGRVALRSKIGPVWSRWEVEHRDYIERQQFCDVQVRGPFPTWEHTHRFRADSTAESTLTDEIHYELPLGMVGRAGRAFVRGKLERLFTYRHAVMREDLEMEARYGAVRSMRFVVSGASGLVGRSLVPFLRSQGHEVVRLVRRKPQAEDELFWNPTTGELDLARLKPIDAVLHLAGESVTGGRWTAARREEIRNSRVLGTRTLVAAMERLRHRPFVLVTASATGFYGDGAARTLCEDDVRGGGFLAEVCEAWEHEAEVARSFGIRVANLRTGLVLTPAGGALAKMLPLFRLGLGGRLGNGRQWMSWISIDDLTGAFYHAVLDQRCNGPVNAVAPEPVTNLEFTATLARVLRRPAVFTVPAPVLKLAFGALAEEMLLASARVMPARLLDAQYRFRHEHLEDALRHVLGRATPVEQT